RHGAAGTRPSDGGCGGPCRGPPRQGMSGPDVVLLLTNVLYATSYVSTRLVLDDLPPATLALLRLLLGGAALALVARRRTARAAPADRWRIAGMGVLGTAAAFALSHWGLALSTATSAALLIVVEPIAIVLASPVVLGERLSRREAVGAGLALCGTVLVVLNGIP